MQRLKRAVIMLSVALCGMFLFAPHAGATTTVKCTVLFAGVNHLGQIGAYVLVDSIVGANNDNVPTSSPNHDIWFRIDVTASYKNDMLTTLLNAAVMGNTIEADITPHATLSQTWVPSFVTVYSDEGMQ